MPTIYLQPNSTVFFFFFFLFVSPLFLELHFTSNGTFFCVNNDNVQKNRREIKLRKKDKKKHIFFVCEKNCDTRVGSISMFLEHIVVIAGEQLKHNDDEDDDDDYRGAIITLML